MEVQQDTIETTIYKNETIKMTDFETMCQNHKINILIYKNEKHVTS